MFNTRYHVSIFFRAVAGAIHFRQKLGIRFLHETSVNSQNSLEVLLLIDSNKDGLKVIRNRGKQT